MPHGRGHNKGFEYYMGKKFFHPNAPHNHEKVFMAKQKLAMKEKVEQERDEEYKREQERWKTRSLLSSEEDRLKMELSFMYEAPAGAKRKKKEEEVDLDDKTGKERGDGWSDSVCYKCDKVGHFARECTQGIKFEWQRNAPRESYCKDDPNINDKPFGIQVTKVRCMKCESWGHSHTDKICPKYGKARDSDQPILQVDPDILVRNMREEQGLRLNHTSVWDNGRRKGKHYEMVYSDDEEQDDLLVSLVHQIRKKKTSKSRRKRKSESDLEEEEERRRPSQNRKRRKRKSEPRSGKSAVLSKVDKILELKRQGKKRKYSDERMMRKVDRILFCDISSTVSQEDRAKARNRFLGEVDHILGLGRRQEEEEDIEEVSESEEEETEDTEADLTESEMRLLNLINHNKIDVKVNFPSQYPDTDCHFCRRRETSEHLARCPVYQGIMRGSEFKDLGSGDVRVVRSALGNIRSALIKRSEALSVTSLGGISSANMRLLDINQRTVRKRTKEEMIDEILATT